LATDCLDQNPQSDHRITPCPGREFLFSQKPPEPLGREDNLAIFFNFT
jgi:hypothetical protein